MHHHLGIRHGLRRPDSAPPQRTAAACGNTVVLAGYQAIGTRGRQLLEGATTIKIHGRYVAVRAEVVDVPMFSVHADAGEIIDWLGQAPHPPQVCYVVHGEPEAAAALRDRIDQQLGWTAVVPQLGERVRLD